jgi:HEAT repeat protein
MNSYTFPETLPGLSGDASQKRLCPRRYAHTWRTERLPVLLLFCLPLVAFPVQSLLAQLGESETAAREEFINSVRRNLLQGDSAAAECTMEMLGRMAEQSRAAGEPLTLVRSFAGDLANLVILGSPRVRGLAARTLAQIEPPVRVAAPALGELLRNEDAELRRAAAESFVLVIRNELNALGPVFRPATRSDLVLAASTILPAVRAGLEDVRPEVRHRCLETIGLACAALTHLMDESVSNDESTRRPLQAEYEELSPLLLALRDEGPVLERLLHHDDPETRILTHKVLEELGVARDHWLRRCAARQEQADEKLLADLLHEAVPNLAEELAHPDARVRRSALDVLEMSGSLALPALPALTRALRDPDRFVRWSAVRTVGKLGPSVDPQTRADLTRLLGDPDVDLRKAAANALQRLQGPPSH